MIESKNGSVTVQRCASIAEVFIEDLSPGRFFRFSDDDALYQLLSRASASPAECSKEIFYSKVPFGRIECLERIERHYLVVPADVEIRWRDCIDRGEGTEE